MRFSWRALTDPSAKERKDAKAPAGVWSVFARPVVWGPLLGVIILAIVIACFVLAVSPPGQPAAQDDPTRQKLEQIGAAYMRANIKLGRPPANAKELLPHLQEIGKPEQILHSPSDGEDFVIVWGVELRNMKATGNAIPIVAYEKVGKDGSRHVLRGRADVVLMSEGQLRGATFPSGYSPLP